MSRKKISTTIYVTQEQSDKLKTLHDRTKVPVAVYIREGIDLVLRHYAHLLPGQATLPLDTQSPARIETARHPTAPRLEDIVDAGDLEEEKAAAAGSKK